MNNEKEKTTCWIWIYSIFLGCGSRAHEEVVGSCRGDYERQDALLQCG